jgi:OmcA/MtrC family decaheme c-type cytochrome
MIHQIHRGAELEYGYVVAGHNASTHDFGHVEYPGDLRNCRKCHVNDSQLLPLPENLLATIAPQAFWSPIEPIAAACLSCHDGDDAASHAFSMTTFVGEACAACHGKGMSFDVEKVHAR